MELERLKRICKDNGYIMPSIKDGKACVLDRFVFTYGILVGVDESRYSHRYCYKTLLDATDAYERWNGVGEPEGFIKRKGPEGQPDYSPDDPFTEGKPLSELSGG